MSRHLRLVPVKSLILRRSVVPIPIGVLSVASHKHLWTVVQMKPTSKRPTASTGLKEAVCGVPFQMARRGRSQSGSLQIEYRTYPLSGIAPFQSSA